MPSTMRTPLLLAFMAFALVASALHTNPSRCGLNLGIPGNGCSSNTIREVLIGVSGQNNVQGRNVSLQSVDLIMSHTHTDDMRIPWQLSALNGIRSSFLLKTSRRTVRIHPPPHPAN
jgi:hypothetical protein